MLLIDTHCHIHSPEFFSAVEAEHALSQAIKNGVSKIILVGTSLEDSIIAIKFAHTHPKNCWVSVGIHPHEASKLSLNQIKTHLKELAKLATDSKVVAIGETGFDFYYNDPKSALKPQEILLRGQIEIALSNGLPLSFHVREAFNDFWRVFQSYTSVQGVLHSFTDSSNHATKAIQHGLMFGINGISTFTSHIWQQELFKNLPLENIVVETDAPFLTPRPKRGNINTPESVIYITEYLAHLRGETEIKFAHATTANAERLFKLT